MTWPGIRGSGQFLTLNIGGGVGRTDWEELQGDASGLIDSVIVIGLRGTSIDTTVPVFGDVLFYDGTSWTPSSSGVIGGGGSHNLLSITHSDTIPSSPVDGDIIVASGSNWGRFQVGSPGDSLTVSSGGDPIWSNLGLQGVEVFTSGSIFNLDADSRRVVVKTGASSVVNLPLSPIFGQEVMIKDGLGSAGSNPISIIPLGGSVIDGLSSVVIGTNFGAFTLLWDGSGWGVI